MNQQPYQPRPDPALRALQLGPFDLEVEGGILFFESREFLQKSGVYFLIEQEEVVGVTPQVLPPRWLIPG